MSCPSREQAKLVFNAIAGADGKITIHELRDAMAPKGYDVVKIFLDIDKDGDKCITEEEFLEQVLRTPRSRDLTAFFDSVDTNKSGEVSLDELKSYLANVEKGKKLLADVEKMMNEFDKMDKDGSKSISKSEFLDFMNKTY